MGPIHYLNPFITQLSFATIPKQRLKGQWCRVTCLSKVYKKKYTNYSYDHHYYLMITIYLLYYYYKLISIWLFYYLINIQYSRLNTPAWRPVLCLFFLCKYLLFLSLKVIVITEKDGIIKNSKKTNIYQSTGMLCFHRNVL